MSAEIPPTDIHSVLQAQIAGRQQGRKVDKEENDRQHNRQEQLRTAQQHASQVEDPDAVEPARQLRDEDRRQGRSGPRDHHQAAADQQRQTDRQADQYIPSKEAREQGLAPADAPPDPPPPPPNRDPHILDLEA